MSTLRDVIDGAGGIPAVAAEIGISERSIYKWLAQDALPRTEFTGETSYSETLSILNNGRFTKDQILSIGRPVKASA